MDFFRRCLFQAFFSSVCLLPVSSRAAGILRLLAKAYLIPDSQFSLQNFYKGETVLSVIMANLIDKSPKGQLLSFLFVPLLQHAVKQAEEFDYSLISERRPAHAKKQLSFPDQRLRPAFQLIPCQAVRKVPLQ